MRSWPSAVSRIRSQLEQNGSETGIDEADLARAVGKSETTRGRRRLRRQLDERPVLDSMIARISAPVSTSSSRQASSASSGMNSMKRTTYGFRRASSASAGTSVSVKPLHRDAVDLDRAQLRVALGFLEPAQDRVERVAARDLGEAHVRERVERDVQALQTGLDERARESVEQHAVRRQREVADAVDRARACPTSVGRSRRIERLAAGEPDLVDAQSREHADEPRDLLEAQDLVARRATPALRPACSRCSGSCTCR